MRPTYALLKIVIVIVLFLLPVGTGVCMGNSRSVDDSDDKEYHIPIGERWRHAKSTVRAPHQLSFLLQPKTIVASLKECTGKLSTIVRPVNSTSVLQKKNHFKKWHSAQCDHYRSYT